jgi:hypothetical protein
LITRRKDEHGQGKWKGSTSIYTSIYIHWRARKVKQLYGLQRKQSNPPSISSGIRQQRRRNYKAVLTLWHAFLFLGLGFSLFSSFCLVASTVFSYNNLFRMEIIRRKGCKEAARKYLWDETNKRNVISLMLIVS